jgi:hypothetical protein
MGREFWTGKQGAQKKRLPKRQEIPRDNGERGKGKICPPARPPWMPAAVSRCASTTEPGGEGISRCISRAISTEGETASHGRASRPGHTLIEIDWSSAPTRRSTLRVSGFRRPHDTTLVSVPTLRHLAPRPSPTRLASTRPGRRLQQRLAAACSDLHRGPPLVPVLPCHHLSEILTPGPDLRLARAPIVFPATHSIFWGHPIFCIPSLTHLTLHSVSLRAQIGSAGIEVDELSSLSPTIKRDKQNRLSALPTCSAPPTAFFLCLWDALHKPSGTGGRVQLILVT